MANKLYYNIFQTKYGWMGILSSKAGLISVTLPQTSRQQIVENWGELAEGAVFLPQFFGDLEKRFQEYYSGNKTDFPVELDYARCTVFQKQVLETTRRIPYGESRSYGWVAGQIGKPKAARAVGGALHKNPFLIIVPCHRVIAGDGNLCGFGGGLPMKKQLLDMEKTIERMN
jgi:methylated-DNA-[protein]-cysteine S-methyltransferase